MRIEKFSRLFNFAPKSKIKAGEGLDKGNFPFYTSSSTLKKRINKAQYFDKALIFGTGGSANIHFAGEPFATSTDCLVAISKDETINIKYVYYYLLGNIHILEQGFKGAGLKHISKDYITNIDIPIQSIEAQNKIVAILDKASMLVSKRERTIQLLNELLRATFLDTFGDVPSFDERKNTEPLGNYISIKHGYAFKSEHFADNGVYILLTPGNFDEKGGFRDRGDKQRYYIGEIPENYILNKGDLLIAMTEQAPGLLGSPLIIAENNMFLHNQRLGLVQKKRKGLNTKFLFYLFNTGLMRNIIHVRSNGVKVRHTSPSKIEAIHVAMPDELLQKGFADYAILIEDSIFKAKNSLDLISSLFSSILQKVFNGQLNFNIDFELDALVREIDLQQKENDLSNITKDIAYLQRLIDKLNAQEFKEKDLYDKAKHAVFQLMAIKVGKKVTQIYNDKTQSIELALQ